MNHKYEKLMEPVFPTIPAAYVAPAQLGIGMDWDNVDQLVVCGVPDS